jgi:hypothetical protein
MSQSKLADNTNSVQGKKRQSLPDEGKGDALYDGKRLMVEEHRQQQIAARRQVLQKSDGRQG